jgi:hypothetical protein
MLYLGSRLSEKIMTSVGSVDRGGVCDDMHLVFKSLIAMKVTQKITVNAAAMTMEPVMAPDIDMI